VKSFMYSKSTFILTILLTAAFAETRPLPPKPVSDDGKIKTFCGLVFHGQNPIDISGIKRKALSAVREKGWKPIVQGTCLVQVSLSSEPACVVSFNGPNKEFQKVSFNKEGEILNLETQSETR
jgi:hypothetical protein